MCECSRYILNVHIVITAVKLYELFDVFWYTKYILMCNKPILSVRCSKTRSSRKKKDHEKGQCLWLFIFLKHSTSYILIKKEINSEKRGTSYYS